MSPVMLLCPQYPAHSKYLVTFRINEDYKTLRTRTMSSMLREIIGTEMLNELVNLNSVPCVLSLHTCFFQKLSQGKSFHLSESLKQANCLYFTLHFPQLL